MDDLARRFEHERDLAIYWFNKSSDLRGAAAALWVSRSKSISDLVVAECRLPRAFSLDIAVPNVYRMLAGMSLELLYKATLVASHHDVPHRHKLNELAALAGLAPNEREKALLSILTDAIEWHGRYPVPKDVKRFRDFRKLVQQHLFEQRPLGRFKVLSPNRALGWDGFETLWLQASTRFWQVYQPE